MLFKVLVDGRSCSGGVLVWSLPAEGQAGHWHEVEGEPVRCRRGLHFTDRPAIWWRPRCRVYLAEAEGVLGTCDDDPDRKVVARRGRLLREATPEELAALSIYSAGSAVVDRGVAVACGTAKVQAVGDARVTAAGDASVTLREKASVVATDDARVAAYDFSFVDARHRVRVDAHDAARVLASGSARVSATDRARVDAYEDAAVDASGDATVVTWGANNRVRLSNRAVWVERSHPELTPAPIVFHAAPAY